MQFKGINEVDLKLLLLGGDSIEVDNLVVKPYRLKEIRRYGYSEYMKNLQWISISIDDFINNVKDDDKKDFLEEQRANLKAYDFYIKLGGIDLQRSLLNAIGMIFRTDDVRILDESVVAIDFVKQGIISFDENGNEYVNQEVLDNLSEDEIRLIHRENFDSLVGVVKLQNYLEKPSEVVKEENPADEETRKLMEHMKKMREKVEAKKKKQREGDDDENIDIADIISAVSSKSHSINKINIWNLTLYQLYDEYARLELIDNYDFSIKAMMAGAEKVDLKHWSSKL
jgi:hypothetical protein